MKISSRFTVAVHILALVSMEKNALCTSEWIADSVNKNPVVIRRIMGMLKKAGFIHIRPGTGGSFMQKNLDDISLLDIYRAVEVVEEDELFHFHENPNPNCSVGSNIHAVLELILVKAQKAMEQVLAEVTLDDLVSVLSAKNE
jgi:Rrf2 family protein